MSPARCADAVAGLGIGLRAQSGLGEALGLAIGPWGAPEGVKPVRYRHELPRRPAGFRPCVRAGPRRVRRSRTRPQALHQSVAAVHLHAREDSLQLGPDRRRGAPRAPPRPWRRAMSRRSSSARRPRHRPVACPQAEVFSVVRAAVQRRAWIVAFATNRCMAGLRAWLDFRATPGAGGFSCAGCPVLARARLMHRNPCHNPQARGRADLPPGARLARRHHGKR